MDELLIVFQVGERILRVQHAEIIKTLTCNKMHNHQEENMHICNK